ncbi:MAG: protease inhibitor I42 family protein [Dehalococcoidia bacterium]|nr:protease inhibitor I42 family protein [Dehalococcoidia bacterium]
MNKCRITMLIVSSVLIISFLACAPAATQPTPPAPEPVMVTVTCDQFSKEAHIVQEATAAVGSTITVTLCSNPTTGFSWGEQAKISDTAVLKQTSQKMVAATTGMVGAPGNQEWTFEALKAGSGTASFSYSRPWEGGEKDVQTFKLHVTVQ